MKEDRLAFKNRMRSLRTYREQNPGKGYWEWRNSLPDNLKYTDDSEYDMKAAYESGAQPVLENDGYYHLPSRDPRSGRILKLSYHDTYWKALEEDAKLGYYPITVNGKTYTKKYDDTWAFNDGGETTDPRIRRASPPRMTLLEIKERNRIDSIKYEKSMRDVNLIMDAMNRAVDTKPYKRLSAGIKSIQDNNSEQAKEKWNDYKKGIEAVATAATWFSGLSGLSRYGITKGFLPANKIVNGIVMSDTGLMIANGAGALGGAYLTISSDSPAEGLWNGTQTALNAAGVVGGSNWFRNSKLFRKHGARIDNVLDKLGMTGLTTDGLEMSYNIVDSVLGYDTGGETLPTRGTTVTNVYGDKTHYIATSIDDDGTLNLSLPDIEITPRNNLSLEGAVDKGRRVIGDTGREALSIATPLGDLETVYEIGKDLNEGNYEQAAIGAGLMLLPNFIEKPIKKLAKRGKNLAAGVISDLITRGDITESGKNRLLNKNILDEVDYFRPYKNRARALTVGDVVNVSIPEILKTTDLQDLTLDLIYLLSDRNVKLANRSTLSPFDFEDSRIVHMDATGPQPINQEGFIPKTEGYAKVNFDKGEVPEIWWSKHTAYYPEEMYRTGRTIVTTKDKLRDAGVVINKDDRRILTTRGTIPFESVEFALEPNIFGWYDRVKYTSGSNLKDNEDVVKKISFKLGGEVEPPYPQFVNGQRVNRWTGQPIATGQAAHVFDLRDAADFTPAGDVLAVKDTYEAVLNNDWVGAGLAAVGVLPFVPSVTKKLRREIPTVNKNYVSNAIDALDRQRYNKSSAEAAMNNETYEIVQRLMDDPSYMRRANEVKYRYGDDYLSTYADLINAYNYSPELLPKAKVTKFEDARRAQMIATPESANRHRQGGEFPILGEYEYQFDPDNAVEGMTLHELDHLVDFLKNKVPDADGNSNMFYRMRLSLKPYSDGISKYYSNPTEQKAYMNLLREFMYKRGMIKTRDEQVTKEMLQEAMNKLPKSMSSIINASKQFKSMRAYTKWFNQIPLLTAGALGINRYYNQQQEQ